MNFPATNNEAEYETFIAGFRSVSKLKVLELHIFSDSKLLVNQVIGKFEVWGAKILLTRFKAVKIEQVGRHLNSHVDALAGLATIFEGEIGRTIVVDLISASSHKMP